MRLAVVDSPQILLVDDDPALLEALSETIRLHLKDAAIHTALSAYEASECLDQNDYDVVITDLVMPEKSGLWLMEEMLKRQLTPAVILLTGHLNPEGYGHLGRAFSFLRKPVDRHEFVRNLRYAIQSGRARRRIAANVRCGQNVEEHLAHIEKLGAALQDTRKQITKALKTRAP